MLILFPDFILEWGETSMDKATFNYIWKQGIVKAAENVFTELPSDIKADYDVKLNTSEEMENKVYSRYDDLRLYVRQNFFNTGNQDENKIDNHKICACITGSLLKIPLISFDMKNEDIPAEIMYSHYEICFLAGIHVMYLLLLSDYKKEEKYDLHLKLEEKSTFEFPETNPGHDTYIVGRVKTLALNDILGVDFDVLTYADMLFWIERYNKELLLKE